MNKNSLRIVMLIMVLVWPLHAHADNDINQPAPVLTLKLLDDQSFKLNQQTGRVVILNFWATWCPPCREEMPLLDTMYKRYKTRGLEVIGISVDRDSHRRQVKDIMRDFSYSAAMQNDATEDGFGWMGTVPDTFIIDKQGVLRVKFEGNEIPLDEKKLTALIEPLLGK